MLLMLVDYFRYAVFYFHCFRCFAIVFTPLADITLITPPPSTLLFDFLRFSSFFFA
jgi:hypothetical protein